MEVFVHKKVKKFLDKHPKVKKKIKNYLLMLKDFPNLKKKLDIKKLKGYEDTYRLRIRKIRVLFRVRFDKNILVVFDIDYRGRVYK